MDLIIVDTSGRHKQEQSLFDEMQAIVEAVKPDEIVFVMDSSIGQAAVDQAEAFKKAVKVGSVIMTKLDGHAKGGGALSAVAATQSPIVFIGTGEHMDDLETFDARSFVTRMLGLGDPEGLVKALQEAGLDKNTELIKKMSEGKFTLRDMYGQLQNMMKMGPIGKVMQMIPGLSNMLPQGAEHGAQERFQSFMTMMDSMTDKELDHPDIQKLLSDTQQVRRQRGHDGSKFPPWAAKGAPSLGRSRIKRIAVGCGQAEPMVAALVEESKKFQKMVR